MFYRTGRCHSTAWAHITFTAIDLFSGNASESADYAQYKQSWQDYCVFTHVLCIIHIYLNQRRRCPPLHLKPSSDNYLFNVLMLRYVRMANRSIRQIDADVPFAGHLIWSGIVPSVPEKHFESSWTSLHWICFQQFLPSKVTKSFSLWSTSNKSSLVWQAPVRLSLFYWRCPCDLFTSRLFKERIFTHRTLLTQVSGSSIQFI